MVASALPASYKLARVERGHGPLPHRSRTGKMLLTCAMVLALNGQANCSNIPVAIKTATYVIQRNDTLRSLSIEFLGTRNRAGIAHENHMGTGHGLRAGYPLNIPVRTRAEYLLLLEKGQNDQENRGGTSVAADNGNPGVPRGVLYDGYYSCRGLEALWRSAGGNPASSFIAAEIAMAESGGNPSAHSPTDDIGLWQVNRPSWGVAASYDPYSNARSAVRISGNGTDWSPWTTYTNGAYTGRC